MQPPTAAESAATAPPPAESTGRLAQLLDPLEGLAERYPWLGSPWLQAVVILVVAWLASRLVDWMLTRIVGRWMKRTRTEVDDRILAICHSPVRTTVLLVGLALATQRLSLTGPDLPPPALPPPFDRYTLSVLKTVAILIWLVFGFRLVNLVFEWLRGGPVRLRGLDERTFPLFNNLAKVALGGAGLYFLFLSWDVDITALVASFGIAGIAVGFAAKDTLANLFAGFFITADAPYKIGDFIVLDTGERGRVTQIGLRTTRLLTRDDIEITVPNAVIANAKIVNESGGPWEKERVRIAVGVAYGSDLDQVYEVLLAVARSHPHVCEEPEPRVRFRAFGASSLDLELLCWIDEPVLRGRMVHELNTEIYKSFGRHGIQIPFPQRDVHLIPAPPD